MVERKKENEETDKPEAEVKKQNVSIDELYRRSSQYILWSFTQESFEQVKREVNEKGKNAAIEKFEQARNTLATDKPELFHQFENQLTTDKLLDTISFEEEEKYLSFYTKNIIQTAEFFKLPTQAKATAVSFFKKFYTVNSVMNYHPKNILYTCVFLAAKSENYFIAIETFCNVLPKTEPKDILDLEFIILQSLKFTLLVHHPFRPLYGFFLDFQAVLLYPSPLMYDVSVDTIGSLYDKAKSWLNEYYLLSDVLFFFTPPQIALAAMYDIDKRITDRYLKRKFLRDNTEGEEFPTKSDELKENSNLDKRAQYETIVRTIRKCIKIAKQIPETTREESTAIDKKCFFTLNPGRLLKKELNKLSTTS